MSSPSQGNTCTLGPSTNTTAEGRGGREGEEREEGERGRRERERREERMMGAKFLSTGVWGTPDLQFGACVFVPEAKPPIRSNSSQCTMGWVECNGIYLGERRGEE